MGRGNRALKEPPRAYRLRPTGGRSKLALDAEVSSRHLSYVETGRSQPSREMVLRLADALEIPLRERNALLVAAGYAPRYFETGLTAPEMAQMRSAIELILRHQEPYPAFVLDRHWDVRMSNQAAPGCSRFLLGAEPTEPNMIRLVLHPNGPRPMIDEYRHFINPVVLGGGAPLFKDIRDRMALKLLKTQTLNSGVVVLYYQPRLGSSSSP